MATPLIAPSMGEGIEELTLLKWLKQAGDAVAELEAIVEVETDKVVTELPSPADGVLLKVLAEENASVQVGQVLAWIGEASEEIPAQGKAAPKEKKTGLKAATPAAQPASPKGEQDKFLSPLVRNMLQENKVDASQISGTGKDGRITKRDVFAYLKKQGKTQPPAASPSAPTPVTAGVVSEHIEPISSVRRTIAERMTHSLRTSAHVLTVMEADMSRVMTHRALNKPLFAQDGVRLTLTAYFIAAITAGLKANPHVNASWSDAGLVLHPAINIGMAVSLGDEGLIVPVIQQADTLSLLGIARQVNDLAERARAKQLKPEEVRGGTFSLTNHGMSGSLFATPIITQPQVGILGTGMMQKRAVVVADGQGNEAIAIRPMIYLSFVFDHRVLDGEGADKFLGAVIDRLENWG